MPQVPVELRRRLQEHGQEHVLAWWDQLSDPERQDLLDQLRRLDLDLLQQLYGRREETFTMPTPERITPAPVISLGEESPEARRLGEEALRRGEVAVLVVAGGQGSRLGFHHPKGMFAIGPVSQKTLFQIHAEKVLALSRRYGVSLPYVILTSPATDAETRHFHEQHQNFGLPAENVHFVCQGTMPAMDMAAGKLIMEKPGRLFASPNGHGGTVSALVDSGLLDQLRNSGVRQIFYFQVDNPLVKVGEPAFLGLHLQAQAEASSKVLAKNGPLDKLGNVVLIDGRCSIIEYSDLPEEMARQTDEQGRLRFWVGSPAIHIFGLEFLDRVGRGHLHMPFHIARKKVPYLDANGTVVEPKKENALKFEKFIFDVLPLAERWTVVEADRREEFAPLKNATGPDSPDTVRQAISDLAADWLEKAHVAVPRRPDGSTAVPLEISPLYALDAEELAAKVKPGLTIQGPTYLE